jgi:hypothetical protein
MGAFAHARGLETHRVSVLLAFLGGFSPLNGEPGPRRGYPRRAAVLRGRLTHDSFDVASEVCKILRAAEFAGGDYQSALAFLASAVFELMIG